MYKPNCEGCSRCCRELTLEIMEIDLMREPKLKEHAVKYMRQGQDMSNPFDQAYRLPTPCPFLEGDLCSIYKSRPNLCVSYNEECLKRQGEE